jgi:hypothetical protein
VSAMLVEGSRGGLSSVAVAFCPAVGPPRGSARGPLRNEPEDISLCFQG